jgi:hypothetical protein
MEKNLPAWLAYHKCSMNCSYDGGGGGGGGDGGDGGGGDDDDR